MATRIVITADANQAKQEAAAVAAGMESIGDKATAASRETKSAADRIERELDEVESEAKSAGRAVADIGAPNTAERITAVASSFTAMVVGLKAATEAGKKAYEGIRFLAENGNADMQRLVDSISGDNTNSLKGALLSIASDPAIGQASSGLANLFGMLSAELETVISDVRVASNDISLFVQNPLAALGLGSDEAAERLRQLRSEFNLLIGMERRAAAEEQNRNAVQQQTLALTEDIAALERGIAETRQRQAAERSGDTLTLSKLIADETKRLEELAAQSKLTNEERARGLQRLATLHASLETAQKTQDSEQEKRHQRELERIDDERALEQMSAEARIAYEQAVADRKRQERLKEKQEQERERQSEIARQQQELSKGGAVDELNRAASDPAALARQLAARRAQQAFEQANEDGVSLRERDRRVEEARRQAFRNAQRQFAGGREEFSQEEIAQAQQDNVNAQMQNMAQSGRFSRETLQALAKATQEQRQQSEEMQAMQDVLKEIQKQIGQTVQDGNRRRSQRNSNRQ